MYVVDGLIDICNTCEINSVNSILANYFLINAVNINNKRLIDVASETNISSSSINRFCKIAGFHTFSSFIDTLYLDVKKIENQLKHSFNHLDFKYISNKTKLDKMIDGINRANNIVIYGSPKYTICFNSLVRYLFFNGKRVYQCRGWDVYEKENIFNILNDNDLIIIIDPNYSIQIYFEELASSLGGINNILNSKAKIYYLGIDEDDYKNVNAIKLVENENYQYVLSSIDCQNYLIKGLMEGNKYEYSDF